MKQFECVETRKAEIYHLQLRGEISSTVTLPLPDMKEIDEVVVDVGDIKYINSIGIQTWMVWTWKLTTAKPSLRFVLERVPLILSTHILSIAIFIPKTSIIKSLFIPYYCEECKESAEKLWELSNLRSLRILDDRSGTFSQMKCQKCQKQMEIDVVPEHYTKLIGKYA